MFINSAWPEGAVRIESAAVDRTPQAPHHSPLARGLTQSSFRSCRRRAW